MLDEVDDDFRLMIYKLHDESSSYGRMQQPDAFRKVGGATVNINYANDAINRVLRPLGIPDSNNMVSQFYRFWGRQKKQNQNEAIKNNFKIH